jgi:hypothetical protein
MRRSLLLLTLLASLSTFWSYVSSLVDEGCIWDPYGQCRPAPQTDEGCIWDPSGQCRPAQGS